MTDLVASSLSSSRMRGPIARNLSIDSKWRSINVTTTSSGYESRVALALAMLRIAPGSLAWNDTVKSGDVP